MLKYNLIAILFTPFFLFAQSDSVMNFNRNYISFSAGIGMPFGGFSSREVAIDDGGPGFANQGLNLNFSIKLIGHNSNNGAIILFSYNSNQFNISDFFNPNQLKTGILTTYNYYRVVYFNEGAGFYKEYSLLAGFSFGNLKYKRYTLDFRFAFGILYFEFPQVYVNYYLQYGTTGYTTNDYWGNDYSSSNSLAPAIDLGSTLKYSIKKRLYALLNLDVLASLATINTTLYYSNNFQNAVSEDNFSAGILLFNINAGLGYRF